MSKHSFSFHVTKEKMYISRDFHEISNRNKAFGLRAFTGTFCCENKQWIR